MRKYLFFSIILLLGFLYSNNLTAQLDCSPNFNGGCTATVNINSVVFNGESGTSINNVTGCDFAGDGIEDYTGLPAPLVLPGNTYVISIAPTGIFTQIYTIILVDWDQNGDYQGYDEYYDVMNHNSQVDFNFTVPPSVSPGFYTFAVMSVWSNPIGQSTYCTQSYPFGGEYEEYTLEVPGITCNSPVVDVTTIDDCANFEFDLDFGVSNFGTALSVMVTDLNGNFNPFSLNIPDPTDTLGPFPAGTEFDIFIEPNDDAFCNVDLGVISSTCIPAGADCNTAGEIIVDDCSITFPNTIIQPNTNSNIATTGNGAQWYYFTVPNSATVTVSSCNNGVGTDLDVHEISNIQSCADLDINTTVGVAGGCAVFPGGSFTANNWNNNVSAGNQYFIEWGNGTSGQPFEWSFSFVCNEVVNGLSVSAGPDPTTDVDISFAAPVSIPYILEYGLEGFTPGTGTVINNPTSPYSITGLLPSETYDFYVEADCFEIGNATSCAVPETITTAATCIPPIVGVFPVCNSDTTFQIQVSITNLGSVNSSFSILEEGVTAVSGLGIGSFMLTTSHIGGTPIDIEIVGDLDQTCSVEINNVTSNNCDCFGVVTNDNCNAAEVLPSIPLLGFCGSGNANVFADLSCGNPGPESGLNSCDTDNNPFNNNDLFYEFIAPPNGNMNVTIDFTPNAINFAIYEFFCPIIGGQEIFCESNVTLSEQFQVIGMDPGSTYYLQIWSDGPFAPDDVRFCLEEGSTVAGADCNNPTSVTVFPNGTCSMNEENFSNFDQTPATVYASCDPLSPVLGGTNYDVWFEFVAPSTGSVNINLENTFINGYTYYAVYESVYPNCYGAELLCDAGFGIGFVVNENISNLVPGNTYLLQVWTQDNNAGSGANNFNLCLTEETCVPPVFLVAEDCYGANQFDIDIFVTDFGLGNPSGYEVHVNSIATGVFVTDTNVVYPITGPYTTGSSITVELVGQDDPTCPGTVTFTGDCDCFGNEPVNDECVNATLLNIGSSLTPGNCTNFIVNGPFDNTCATPGIIGLTEFEPIGSFGWSGGTIDDGWFQSIGVFLDNTLWFEIVGTGGNIVITIDGTPGVPNPINNFAQMALFDDCPGGTGSLIAYTDLANPSSNGNTIDFDTDLGESYFLVVDHFGFQSNSGNFNLELCSAPPPCTLSANGVVQTNPCNPTGDGTFFITSNLVYSEPIGTEVFVQANGVTIDTIIIDPNLFISVGNILPIPSFVLTGGDLNLHFEFTAASFCFADIVIDVADLPGLGDCPVITAPTVVDFSTDASSYCSGEIINFALEVTQNDNWPVDVTLYQNGNLASFLTDTDGDGIYTASIISNNNGCEPLVTEYSLEIEVDDYANSGTLLPSTPVTINVFPTTIEQFFAINTIDYCTVEVSIDNSCNNFLVLNSPSTQTGVGEDTLFFDYQYITTNPCFANTGTLEVPYSCYQCPLVTSTNFSATELCDGEQLSFSVTIDPPDQDNVAILVESVQNGPLVSLAETSPGSGLYTASVNVTNNGCAPIFENYVLTVICNDNNALLSSNTQQVNIYPSNIDQFLDIVFLNDCSANVQVSDLCTSTGFQYLTLNSPNIQNANEDTQGIFSYVWQYNGAGNACFNSAGVLNLPYDCPPIVIQPDLCDGNDAGTVPSMLNIVCADEIVLANTFGASVANNYVMTYVCHNGSDTNIGNIFDVSFNGFFENEGNYPTNTELCITAVVGAANGLGLPTDICDFSNCLPVVFLDPVTINGVDALCNNVTSDYTVSYSLAGGAPAYDPDAYNYSVDLMGQMMTGISAGQIMVSNPLTDPFFEIEVFDDGNGCGTLYQSDSVVCSELPVELLSFKGFLKENGNFLKWETASEKNSAFFTLMYSKNGTDFEAISQIEAAGNSSNNNNYEYLHASILSGEHYYKLTQTDIDGQYKELDHVVLQRSKSYLRNIEMYPNPVNNVLNINCFVSNNKTIGFEIINSKGKEISNFNINAVIGNNTKSIDVSKYPVGLYFVKVNDPEGPSIIKFIKE